MAWWSVLLVALAGTGVALALRTRRYRREDDVLRREVRPSWVAVWATVAALLAVPFWRQQPPAVLLTFGLAIVWAATLTLIDLELHVLPDVLTLPAYPVVALLLTWCSATTHDWAALARAAACGGAAVAVFTVVVLVSPDQEGLGVGDVKLAGTLAALLGWFSWVAALYGLLVGLIVAGLLALVLLATRRGGRRSTIPVGPPLLLGAYLVGLTLPVLAA